MYHSGMKNMYAVTWFHCACQMHLISTVSVTLRCTCGRCTCGIE